MPQQQVDNAALHWGVKGNIGGRDSVAYGGYDYGLGENVLEVEVRAR